MSLVHEVRRYTNFVPDENVEESPLKQKPVEAAEGYWPVTTGIIDEDGYRKLDSEGAIAWRI